MTNQPHTLLTESAPNKGVQLTAYSLRLATLCCGFRQQLTPGVLPALCAGRTRQLSRALLTRRKISAGRTRSSRPMPLRGTA